jgi:hypothetical protein
MLMLIKYVWYASPEHLSLCYLALFLMHVVS